MAGTLSKRFFAEIRDPIPLHFPDDPPALTPRDFATLDKDEVFTLLKATTNQTAPGTSDFG